MKKFAAVIIAVMIFGCYALSQDDLATTKGAPLLQVQEIPLPNVGGRIDHFTFDGKRKRVIGAALGNNTVEVVDTFAGKDIHSITGAADPQGVVFVGEFNRLFVANGTDGKLRIYDGDSFSLLNTVDIGEDADNVRYDPAEKRVYVAYGNDEEGGIAVIDAASSKRLEDAAKLDAHPESFQIATSKPVIYANIATKAKVVVINRNAHKVTDWPLKAGKANYPMALDEADHRIFVVIRKPAQLIVLDSDSGATVASVPCVNDADDLYYDVGRKRVFRGDTLELLDSIHLDVGPNRLVYEPHSKLVYVGYGGKDAGKDYGEVGVIDARKDKVVASIKVAAHPSELLLDKSGTTLFVFISIANQLQVIDTNKRQVVATWRVSSQRPGDSAFDQSTLVCSSAPALLPK
jgi:DNA-binding beta-propeller fold protein YncE